MRKVTVVLAISALLAAAGAVTAFGSTKTVKWHLPTSSTISISKGSTVKWVWTDSNIHTVKGRGFQSKESGHKGHSYSHTFRSKGTFTIVCGIHGSEMKTKVKVG
jgi:plastocyanin